MSACPQCGIPSKPTDKFCNSCGFALQRSSGGGLSPSALSPQPFAPPPPPPRCQQGHDIPPGGSYCSQGHPIAIDAMRFGAADPFSAPAPYPTQQPSPFGGTPSPFGGGGFGQPQQPQGFVPEQQTFPVPQQQQQGFGQPPQVHAPPPPFGPSQGVYGGTASPFNQPPPVFGGGGGGVFNAAAVAPQFNQGMNQPPVQEIPRDVPAKIIRGFLVTYQPNAAGDSWTLTGGRHTIGRVGGAEGIDIALADPTISSRHAALLVDAASGAVMLEDTGSTNGTFVNDEHLGFNGKRELRDGDRLRFGGLVTIVKLIGRI